MYQDHGYNLKYTNKRILKVFAGPRKRTIYNTETSKINIKMFAVEKKALIEHNTY